VLKTWLSVLLLLPTTSPAVVAEERKHVPTASITQDENGLLILEVTLHSLKSWNTTRTFRFLLDTGADWCIVDRSVPTEFFWDEPNTETTTRDIADQKIATPTILLKRVEVGTLMRDGVVATRMDLRSQIGRFQDQPVDGILGMSFLRGTRFLLDPKGSRLVWWEYHFSPGETVPISDRAGGPWISVRIGGQEALAAVDTGMSGGVDLPISLKSQGATRGTVSIGLSGVQVAGSEARVDRLELGSSAWMDVPVDFQGGEKSGRIGIDVWFAAPVCFDFITNHLTLTRGESGNLPIRSKASQKLPLAWDRSGSTPRLRVLLVKPGSSMAQAGCLPGDELIQAGGLQGPTLTRRAVQELVASHVQHQWIIHRNGQELKLEFGPF